MPAKDGPPGFAAPFGHFVGSVQFAGTKTENALAQQEVAVELTSRMAREYADSLDRRVERIEERLRSFEDKQTAADAVAKHQREAKAETRADADVGTKRTAIVISLVALLGTLANLGYTIWKDNRSTPPSVAPATTP